jgi:hypothetical protein
MTPNGYRFIGIAPEVDLTERRSKLINDQTEPFTVDEIRGYKVFTALLTQSGGENIQYYDEGSITIGVTYSITANVAGELGEGDFTNVGAPNNLVGTHFIATGTTPNSWGTFSELEFNTGAPLATVLENTIGNIWFTYGAGGEYYINSNDLFTQDKTFFLSQTTLDNSPQSLTIIISRFNNNTITLKTLFEGSSYENDWLANTPIEIRVYN